MTHPPHLPICLHLHTDDSTSMKYADNGERIDDLKLILERVSEVGCSGFGGPHILRER